MYAIFDGTHYNGGCCFDYGNAETDSRDDGNGTMEAIYFGNIRVWGYGTGNGPWIMADLENGLYSGVNAGYNAGDPTINHRNTTASGAAIDQWTCNGQTNQQFQFLSGSGGYGELQAQNSGQVIAVANNSTTAGTPDIVQQARNGAANTMWKPTQQSDGSYQFQ